MGDKIGKNLSENVRGKYSQKLLDYAEQSATNARKTSSKRVIQKTGKATGDLICKKTAKRIKKYSRGSKTNNLEKYRNENHKEIPKERYISPEKRHKIINDLRLI